MKQSYFVTGTDTDAGKTLVASALLHLQSQQGLKTIGLKPLSAGCEQVDGELRNSDALSLMEQASVKLSYQQVNPIAFEPPIAPHLAAEQAGVRLSADKLQAYCRGSLMRAYDFALVEGAGGWRVPLSDRETLADLAKMLNFPVILVVGMKLGCISHALLTAEAIYRDGLQIAGWVANQIDPQMSEYQANLAWLKRKLPGAFLGEIPYLDKVDVAKAATYLSLEKLAS